MLCVGHMDSQQKSSGDSGADDEHDEIGAT
jgi:hypothetical protein